MRLYRVPSSLLLGLGLLVTAAPRSAPAAGEDLIPADRRIDWTLAGIPARSVPCVTLDAAASGNGSTDATAAIQAALDACLAGQVVGLPAGT